ncbi:group II intron reverse transcriptase/maturase [Actinophytocola sediminis]
MLSTLAEKIHDNRFLRLVRNMLTAGYLEDWVWNATLSGVPQGGVVSPTLSNIYLHRLDEFVETVLIPEHTRGRVRKQSTEYARVRAARDRAHQRGDHALARELRKQVRGMPSGDPHDPGFRRLQYARYADDTLLGFAGPKAEAEEIKQRLTTFLRDELKLELSQDKTLITHARTQAAKFLGYEISVLHNDRKVTRGRRSANGIVSLRVPEPVIKAKKAPYLSRGKPERRPHLINEDDHTIVNTYGAEWRGIVQYYLLAGNVHRLYRLHWVMETSLLKTLANKRRSSVSKMASKYAATISTAHGPRKCFEARIERSGRKPLVTRFSWRIGARSARTRTASRCTTEWAQLMARRRRKTLVVCRSCHDAIHSGQSTPQLTQ